MIFLQIVLLFENEDDNFKKEPEAWIGTKCYHLAAYINLCIL